MPDGRLDYSQPFPLFPLAHTVLLPHCTVPLHIFEQRYRDMTADALDGRRLIAMASFDGDEYKHDYEGAPTIRPCVCIGYMVRHERLDDGRYNILLQGISRARIVDELDAPTLYRQAQLEPIETDVPMELDLERQRKRLEQLIKDPLLQQLGAIRAVHDWLTDEVPTTVLADLATLASCDSEADRYRMLAECQAAARIDWLEAHLKSLRHTLQLAQRLGSAKSDDGLDLN